MVTEFLKVFSKYTEKEIEWFTKLNYREKRMIIHLGKMGLSAFELRIHYTTNWEIYDNR